MGGTESVIVKFTSDFCQACKYILKRWIVVFFYIGSSNESGL